MITLTDIRLQRGNKPLLKAANATFYTGQKIALIGANGSGKSSLFQLILGQLSADEGQVDIPQQWRIAQMAQEVAVSKRRALDYVVDGDQALRQVEQAIDTAQQHGLDEKLGELHAQLDAMDGYRASIRAEQLLMGLGFSLVDIEKPVNQFSGGWRIRLNLAQALMSPSDLLLLDEPTNHLDLDAQLWLEQWLHSYPGSLLLISHDRDFIDTVCQEIVHIEHHTLTSYKGNYSAFEQQRAMRLAQQQAQFEKQQQRKQEIEQFVNRFRAKATKAKQAQSRLKELARMAEIAPAHVDSAFHFSFPGADKVSDPLLSMRQAELGYDTTGVVHNVSLTIHPGSRIGLLGANGAGKSTLLKSLAASIPLVRGQLTHGEHLRIGYFSQHQLEALDLAASPLLHLQRLTPQAKDQEMRNFLGGFNFHGDAALNPIKHFSGGEKARLSLALIVWQKPNLLLLDEPTNHLDLDMCHALTVALQGFNGALVVISHDRHLIRNTVDELLLVGDGRCQLYEGDLEDYARYLLTQQRINATSNPPQAQGIATKKQQRIDTAKLRKQLNPITSQIKKLEGQLDATQTALNNTEHLLADNALYEASNKDQLHALLQQQVQLKQTLDQQEMDWLDLNEQLEKLKEALDDAS